MDAQSEPPANGSAEQEQMFSWRLWYGRPSAGSFGHSHEVLEEARIAMIRDERLSRQRQERHSRSIGRIATKRINK